MLFRRNKKDATQTVAPIKTKKSSPIQLNIIIAMERAIDELNKLSPEKPKLVTLPVPSEVKALMDAGFTNARIVKEFMKKQIDLRKAYDKENKAYSANKNKINELKNALKLLIAARVNYGPGTLLLPLEQFKELCKKYDLVCGGFDRYAGDVPADKLAEINKLFNAHRLASHELLYSVTTVHKSGSGSTTSRSEWRTFDDHFDPKFPFIRDKGRWGSRYTFLDNFYYDFTFVNLDLTYPSPFFIAAPKKLMNGEVKEVYETNEDPIIFGICGNNVLLFTRWGEEADDETILRCAEFNKKLDAFAKSLNV